MFSFSIFFFFIFISKEKLFGNSISFSWLCSLFTLCRLSNDEMVQNYIPKPECFLNWIKDFANGYERKKDCSPGLEISWCRKKKDYSSFFFLRPIQFLCTILNLKKRKTAANTQIVDKKNEMKKRRKKKAKNIHVNTVSHFDVNVNLIRNEPSIY